ncbi:MAG TPA: glycosyltransferase family 39 protein [Candidatus Angelobacter sp.]|nr:glycosyltransferase family 39 protein [Candidatus Angelobacter sp.]
MLQVLREFRVGRPQIFAGTMLLVFLAQCLWAAHTRKMSELEYRYIASGLTERGEKVVNPSPFTGWIASLPVRLTTLAKKVATPRLSAALAVPRPWLLRLPFIVFGFWLGGALWWVARRLFDDEGGYVALALYCTSPAMISSSSNIGPEIILAWSSLGLIYTAIGVAHTLYAPPKKWVPRIAILGLSIGFALATAWWSVTLVLLAFAYMMYLAPGCRRKALFVLASASAIGCAVWAVVFWLTGSAGLGAKALFSVKPGLASLGNLTFALSGWTDGYVLVFLFIAALTGYGSWPRARYFGNTAPLITGLTAVFLFSLVPAIHIWDATLGLCFVFIFIGGLAADFLETRARRLVALILAACFLLRTVLTVIALRGWAQNLM